MRLPDGAILEVFGDISSASLLPDVKALLMRKQANYEEQAQRTKKQTQQFRNSTTASRAQSPVVSQTASRAASRAASRGPSPTLSRRRVTGTTNQAFQDASESNA